MELSIKDMLDAGIHYGHRTRFWHPAMQPYIYGERNGVHIINLDLTLPMLQDALNFIGGVIAQGGNIWFVGTKRTATSLVEQIANECNQPYVNNRWLGGMLTNYKTVLSSLKRFDHIESELNSEKSSNYSKKEKLSLMHEREKILKNIGGVRNTKSLPDILFVVDIGHEKIAIAEAKKLGIPVVAIVDTNYNPQDIDFLIPGNDDSSNAIAYYLNAVKQTVLDSLRLSQNTKKADDAPVIIKKTKVVKTKQSQSANSNEEKPAQAERPATKQKSATSADKSDSDIKLVKELRQRTQAGVLECKKALSEASGDIEKAADLLRQKGAAKADKRASRIAAEGFVGSFQNDQAVSMVEVNCETDFVSKSDEFRDFCNHLAQSAVEKSTYSVDDLMDETNEKMRQDLMLKVGENIQTRRLSLVVSDKVNIYSHGGKMAAIVELEKVDKELAKDLAMHVAAISPIYIDKQSIEPETIEREKNIALASMENSDKPKEILEKVVSGKVNKVLSQMTLLGQDFVKDPELTVEKLLKQKSNRVIKMVRYAAGEGIDKKQEDFVQEVMDQAKSS